MININNYSLSFSAFAYRYKMEGKYEISAKYKIPTKTLIGKIKLPNQEIESIELVPIEESCTFKSHIPCQIFKSESFINFSSDKYFAREIKDEEYVPLQISFEFNTDNLPLFLHINRLNQHYNRIHVDLITKIKQLKININFPYKNTIELTRYKHSKENYSLNILKNWIIKNGINNPEYEQIEVRINRYNDLIKTGIKEWFSIKKIPNININQIANSIEINGSKEIHQEKLEKRIKNKEISFSFVGGGGGGVDEMLRMDSNKKIIYFPYKISGILKSKLRIIINQFGFGLNINSHFNFLNNPIFTENKKLILRITNKWIQPIANLHKYKQIRFK